MRFLEDSQTRMQGMEIKLEQVKREVKGHDKIAAAAISAPRSSICLQEEFPPQAVES